VSDRDYRWKWHLRLCSLALFAAVWEYAGRSLGYLTLPPFSSTAAALLELLREKTLWHALWISNQALVIGMAGATCLAVPLGIWIGRNERAERFSDLWLNLILVTPMAALIPVVVLAVGIGLTARSLVVGLFAVAVIAVNTRAGLRGLNPSLADMAHSFGASEMQIWRLVLLPGALPAIVSGLRLGLGRAIAGMVVVELLLVAVGIGDLLMRYRADFESARVFAVILVVLAEALAAMALLTRLESALAGRKTGEEAP
jgi:ABC-type nitrate/sulfonate/bicarbonate transport system permease component